MDEGDGDWHYSHERRWITEVKSGKYGLRMGSWEADILSLDWDEDASD